MAHFVSDYTSNAVPAIHAGVNVQCVKKTLATTASGSQSILLTPLPAGARVTGCKHAISNSAWGTGGEHVSVFATIGGIVAPASAEARYITSATVLSDVATGSRVAYANDAGLGKRLTASANLWAVYNSLVGTGTGSVEISVVVEYLADKRGD
jgi:hypothetical protein